MQRILIVDDDPVQRKILSQILRDEYDIETAADGQEALKMVRSSPPDLLLLDVMMPIKDGFEVARELRLDEDTKEIDIVFITSESDMDSRMKGWDLGAAWYITKPVDPKNVRETIRTHFAAEK